MAKTGICGPIRLIQQSSEFGVTIVAGMWEVLKSLWTERKVRAGEALGSVYKRGTSPACLLSVSGPAKGKIIVVFWLRPNRWVWNCSLTSSSLLKGNINTSLEKGNREQGLYNAPLTTPRRYKLLYILNSEKKITSRDQPQTTQLLEPVGKGFKAAILTVVEDI